jgi:hypothetical protein
MGWPSRLPDGTLQTDTAVLLNGSSACPESVMANGAFLYQKPAPNKGVLFSAYTESRRGRHADHVRTVVARVPAPYQHDSVGAGKKG